MDPVSLGGDSGDGSTSDIAKIAGEDQQQEEYHPQPSQPQPQQKKQGRRRLHTSRPYKERLLNMAEARRQIVAALKSHRAAMKGASGQQKRPQKGSQQREPTSLERAQDEMIRTKKNPRAHPSNTTSNSPLSLYNNTSLSCPRFSCAYNSTSLVPFPENLSLLFPAGKPLGLNLNYHGFNNMHIVLHGEGTNPPINHSSSSSFSSCHASPTISSRAVTATTSTSVALHKATGAHDQETEGIRSDGDQQKMEGNKKLNSSTSSLWCKILETSTERSPQAPEAGNGGGGTERDVLHMFDEALDMPPYWLEDQHRLDDYYPEEYCLHDDALTCGSLDIGEIDEMDCGWLS